jgi:hypothetical protein
VYTYAISLDLLDKNRPNQHYVTWKAKLIRFHSAARTHGGRRLRSRFGVRRAATVPKEENKQATQLLGKTLDPEEGAVRVF